MFRRFFGFPDPGPLDGPENSWDRENFDRPNDVEPFQSLFMEQDEMFRHFERQFENIFKNFGFMDFTVPPIDNYGEEQKTDEESNTTIRDRMLKRPEEKLPTISPWSKFWTRPNFDKDRSNLQDSDLDGDVSKRGLENVLTDRNVERPQNGRSFFSSTVVTKIRGPDGKIEERHTKSDGYGNEETIVTRKVGDRSHSVMTRKDKTGIQEHQENFVNMDDRNLEEFDKEWSASALKQSLTPPSQFYGGDVTAPKLFSNLFEKFLPLNKPDV